MSDPVIPRKKPALQPLPTGIETLDDLLAPVDPSLLPGTGFAHLPQKGFFGVIFGASCLGKSVLSLQLACRFVSPRADQRRLHHAVYLTQEPSDVIRARALEGFRFLTEEDVAAPQDGIDPDGAGRLTIVAMPLDPEAQQERLIDVFELINARFCCKDRDDFGDPEKDLKQRLLIVVDNAETIRTEAYLKLMDRPVQSLPRTRGGNGRREFFKPLREYCHRHRLRTWFSFEEELAAGASDERSKVSTAAETYAADGVIRLSVSVRDGGFHERCLEIVKARDQFYRRGAHHFTIRGFKAGGFSGPSATDDSKKTGIIVFPSLPTQLHRLSREEPPRPKSTPEQSCALGIETIDREVRLANHLDHATGYLSAGTVTVLVADLDSMGTDLALHFIAQPQPANPETPDHWLYISFHHESLLLCKIAHSYRQTAACEAQLENIAPYEHARGGRCLFLPPEHISESKLLYDIDCQIKKFAAKSGHPLRVVVDDLYALVKRFNLLNDKDDFIAALFQLFRRRGVIALLLDTVEVGEGRNPLEQSVPAGMADHVFLLRHIEFQTRTRKVFSILKLAEFSEPSLHWELARDDEAKELTAKADRFQFFKGLLSGRPEPVQITLSLYADSPRSPQHLYVQKQQTILSKTFGQHIEIHPCHPEDYAVLQQTVGQKGLPVLGDCHIISVDEIWLDELIAQGRLKGFRHDAVSEEFHWDRLSYVTVAHDLACEKNGKKTGGPERHHFAIPDRQNCGVLAFNPPLKTSFKNIPWIDGNAPPSWTNLVDLQSAFLRDHYITMYEGHAPGVSYRMHEPSAGQLSAMRARREALPSMKHSWGVFTFSMENRECCVSFLLELVLSRLHVSEALVDEEQKLQWKFPDRDPWGEALKLLLGLLDPWDIARLADSWFRPCPEERPCLFSRQWFTSWGALGCRFPGLKVMELPSDLDGKPAPVSGTWYLAMLDESSAISAGKALIKRLTSPDDELHRLNNGIGLPVSVKYYQATEDYQATGGHHQATGRRTEPLLEILPCLPYSSPFAELPEMLSKAREARGSSVEKTTHFHSVLRNLKCPFHRPTIKNYSKVSPVLMGLMVRVARAALDDPWLTDRTKSFTAIQKVIDQAVQDAPSSCDRVTAES